MASDRILELLRRPVDVEEYAEIRELWKTHSIAEDNRDLPGLISTLTDDCVYEVMGTGARWEGHEGDILRNVFFHSLALAALVGLLVLLQAYVFTSMIVK